MKVLAVDTSGPTGSLAVSHPAKQIQWTGKAIHSEVITLKLLELGMELKQLTHLIVNVGPGSFTGLRVGFNLARTLAYALNLPVAPVGSLEVLASHSPVKTLVAIKTVQNFFYVAGFEAGVPVLAPQSVAGEELRGLSQGYTKVLIEGQTPGFTAQTQARELLPFANLQRFCDWKDVYPLYIRASEAEEKLRQGLLKPL